MWLSARSSGKLGFEGGCTFRGRGTPVAPRRYQRDSEAAEKKREAERAKQAAQERAFQRQQERIREMEDVDEERRARRRVRELTVCGRALGEG